MLMKKQEFLNKLDDIISKVKTGVLTTVDAEGKPHTRWMSPIYLSKRPGLIFTVTSKSFTKKHQLEENPHTEWMIQTRDLREIMNVSGITNIIDNASLRSELLEKISDRLDVFWKLCHEEEDLVVLETLIDEISYYKPMECVKLHTVLNENPEKV
ncbi:MAG TPA: pyridoxamine 5'-phosphate oxidase family protein [Candidatus Marinimicrobia bacterium]|nr:pyridoxamine 5'-phosphate oxidase family protein [Candidatus Neomarinimicrobiota bacterium]